MWAVVGAAMLAGTIGCAREMPLAPSVAENSASPAAAELTSSSYPVVTLMPDLTASPQVTTVSAGTRVKFVNNSGRYAKVHSYNCSEFSGVNLPNGGWINTWAFTPAGKTCDFFVWDTDYTRKLFEGQVVVR
jgi:plastocyanin